MAPRQTLEGKLCFNANKHFYVKGSQAHNPELLCWFQGLQHPVTRPVLCIYSGSRVLKILRLG
jgi:hypothetical protein